MKLSAATFPHLGHGRSLVFSGLIAGAMLALFTSGCGREAVVEVAKASPAPAQSTAVQPVGPRAEIKYVVLTSPLNQHWVAAGKSTYEAKCASCHKLTATKSVGPGWLHITFRREPAWIMNMIINVDMMLVKDPEAQQLLARCGTRMPDLNVSEPEARQLLEFMRSNDGEK